MNNMEVYYKSILLNLEQAAKGNRFKSKEELYDYIKNMKQRGIPESYLTEEEILRILNLYDEYHRIEQTKLDMQDYKGVSLDGENYIVSTQNDSILKTQTSNNGMTDEFKTIQNEITATSNDGLANADAVYENLKNAKKEEVDLIPIQEAVERDNIDSELLSKIRFFITNRFITPYAYKVSITRSIFYNPETNELLTVRKNPVTGKYEICKGQEVVYKDDSLTETVTETLEDDNQELVTDTNGAIKPYEERSDHKVRRRVPPKLDQAAFIKSTFILVVIVTLSISLAVAILMFK